MIIDLLTVDEAGKDYNFDEKSDELSGVFADLIGSTAFRIYVEIKPLGNSYLITGQVSSHYPEVCSQCGYDITVPLQNKINEIVVIEKLRPRNTQVSQSKQNFDSEGPAVTYINETQFDLSEFLHEMMAASFSSYPKCADKDQCKRQQSDVLQKVEAEKIGHPGFSDLKNFKTTKH